MFCPPHLLLDLSNREGKVQLLKAVLPLVARVSKLVPRATVHGAAIKTLVITNLFAFPNFRVQEPRLAGYLDIVQQPPINVGFFGGPGQGKSFIINTTTDKELVVSELDSKSVARSVTLYPCLIKPTDKPTDKPYLKRELVSSQVTRSVVLSCKPILTRTF